MAETVRLIDPRSLSPNPDNPRLIFRQDEIEALQKSIADQGILVPLTVFLDGKRFRILDGERRWKCAVKLRLRSVPAIVQPKPERLQNLMMMFAIHNARKDWDPLPTAMKLSDLESEFRKRYERAPSETELAGLASISRGEVRRLKKLLQLPSEYRDELLEELEKPRHEQTLTVDHVIEATSAAAGLRKRGIVDATGEDRLRKAIIAKFRSGVIDNTVAPRKLLRLGRAVERGELSLADAVRVVTRLVKDAAYSIDAAFEDSVEQADFQHRVEQVVSRLSNQLGELTTRRYRLTKQLRKALEELRRQVGQLLG